MKFPAIIQPTQEKPADFYFFIQKITKNDTKSAVPPMIFIIFDLLFFDKHHQTKKKPKQNKTKNTHIEHTQQNSYKVCVF